VEEKIHETNYNYLKPKNIIACEGDEGVGEGDECGGEGDEDAVFFINSA
jgi:hypothetical protein